MYIIKVIELLIFENNDLLKIIIYVFRNFFKRIKDEKSNKR